MSLERLIAEHDAIDVISRSLRAAAKQGQPACAMAVSLLSQLAQEVDAHLAYEDRTVTPS
jgi:hypothetical protein